MNVQPSHTASAGTGRRCRVGGAWLGPFLVVGVLVLASAASASLPTKPECSDVTSTVLQSTFSFSFSTHWTSKGHRAKTVDHLGCVYRSADGALSIDYNRYLSAAAARAHYVTVRKSLTRRGNAGASSMSVTQLLPLVELRGVGDVALRSTDGTVIEFVDGVDSVTIEHGFADISPRTTRAMVALAGYVDHHG